MFLRIACSENVFLRDVSAAGADGFQTQKTGSRVMQLPIRFICFPAQPSLMRRKSCAGEKAAPNDRIPAGTGD